MEPSRGPTSGGPKIILDIESEIDFAGLKSDDISKDIEIICNKVINDHLDIINAETIELCVAIIDDNIITQLNKDFRGVDKATNVLSFPNSDIRINNYIPKADDYVMLGDVVISHQTLEKEAIEQQKNVINHMRHLLIHGILHLMGYDHENDQDAQIMEQKEEEILSSFGISSPYKNITR